MRFSAQVSTFNKLMNISSGGTGGECADDDTYKTLTALGILAALQALVKATFNATQVNTVSVHTYMYIYI